MTLYQPLHGAIPPTAWRYTTHCMALYHPLHDALPPTAWRYTTHCMTLYQPLHGAIPPTAWRYTTHCMTLYHPLHDAIPPTAWRYTTHSMALYRPLHGAIPSTALYHAVVYPIRLSVVSAILQAVTGSIRKCCDKSCRLSWPRRQICLCYGGDYHLGGRMTWPSPLNTEPVNNPRK